MSCLGFSEMSKIENLRERLKIVLKNVSVEPNMFLLSLCMDEQLEVQKYASVLQGHNQVIQAIPSIIFTILAGPWSDIHGRKLLIVVSTFGYVLNSAVFIFNTLWFMELTAEYLLLEVLQDCTGGYVVFWLASYSYIADITTKEERTYRIALADGLFPAGYYAGKAISGPLYDNYGFLVCFIFSLAVSIIAFLYAAFVLKLPNLGKCATCFEIDNITGGFKAVFKQRNNSGRRMIMLLTVCFGLIVLCNRKSSTEYLYFRRHFSWSTTKFSVYSGVIGFVGMVAMYAALPWLSNKMKLHDMTIGILAGLTSIIHMVILCAIPADENYDWLIYMAGIQNMLRITHTTVTRSLVTKCVEPTEVGRVFSMFGLFQAVLPLFAGPIYGNLYKHTVAVFPGAFLLVCAALYTDYHVL